MIDVDLPPVRRFRVVDDDGNILLITSGILTASLYQLHYDKAKPPKGHRINCDGFSKSENFISQDD